MNFYKRDPDRALSGMAELTLQERGAYNTIIDLLYARDGVVPDDDEMLRRLMGCHGNEWRAVKSKLIAKGKVWIEGGFLKAKRVDDVLREAAEFSETQGKRAANRRETAGKQPGNVCHISENINENNTPKKPSTPTPTARNNYRSSEFEDWWKEYPRKVSKGTARKAYAAALKKIAHSQLLEATKRYAASVVGKEQQFIPHPSTWLNGERWGDIAEPVAGQPPTKPTLQSRVDVAKGWLSRNSSIAGHMDDLEVAHELVRQGFDYDQLRRAGYSLPIRGNVVDIGSVKIGSKA